jgi:hypothetical protein
VAIRALDSQGFPGTEQQVWPVSCGEIRHLLVDAATGKLYVACTAPPRPEAR